MARFIVVDKSRTRVESDDKRLDIGSRSSSSLTLDDPVVASTHCEILYQEGQFWLRDLGSVTGTYLNGLKVFQPVSLSNGDAMVVGASRLLVQVGEEAGKKQLRLELQEKQFYFQRAGQERGEQAKWIIGDREAWRESEVSFSRFPLLWNLVWGAIALTIVLAVLLVWPAPRHMLTEPGVLHETHARLFARDGNVVIAGDIAAVAADGCAACHAPFAGVPMNSCYACHAEIRSAHPARSEHAAEKGWHEESCVECHVEHRHTMRGDARFVPPPDTTAKSCAACHNDETFTLEAADRFMIKPAMDRSVADAPPEVPSAPVPYNAFDHRHHIEKGRVKDCAVCHRVVEDTIGDRDFAYVGFQNCMGCHNAESNRAFAEIPPNPSWAPRAPDFALDWHGATANGEKCLACHAVLHLGKLRESKHQSVTSNARTVPGTEMPNLVYALERRTHSGELVKAQAVVAGACETCHARATWLAAAQLVEGVFWHRVHVTRLAVTERGAELELSKECMACHEKVAQSGALATPAYLGEESSCGDCHAGGERTKPVLQRERLVFTDRVARTDFPHTSHVNFEKESLGAGCYSCHEFRAAAGAAEYQALPATTEDAKSCKPCHDKAHANIGGGSCQRCHAAGDPVYQFALDAPGWPVRKERTERGAFRHYSPGHSPLTKKDCAACHGDVSRAERIDAIVIPREESAACRTCHVVQRQRFHWR